MAERDDRQRARVVLANWAQWVDGREGGALGYSRVNILARGVRQSWSTDHIPVGLQQAETVDGIVRRLRVHDTTLWVVLMCAYLGDPRVPQRRRRTMGAQDIAGALHMHVETVRRRLREAEDWVVGTMDADERAAAAARRDAIGG